MSKSTGNKFWLYFFFGFLYWFLSNFFGSFETTTTSFTSFSLFVLRSSIVLILLLPLKVIYDRIFEKSRSILYIFSVVLGVSLFFGFIYILTRALVYTLFINNPDPWFSYDSFLSFIQAVLISGQWQFIYFSIIYFGIRYWLELKSEKEISRNAIILAQKAQLQMLRYQLNPHFLFNSLNSIQALVHVNPEKADVMVAELSEFLRSTLQYNDKVFIPVMEEIALMEKYLSIEKVRFRERLDYTIKVEEYVRDFLIPSFLTQPLVENAVKYGLRSEVESVTIQISCYSVGREIIIEISNTGSISGSWVPGFGITNVRERLENSYNGKYIFGLTESDDSVIARITIFPEDE